MHRLRQTLGRFRRRHSDSVDGIDSKKKVRRFHLPAKLKFLKKFRRDKRITDVKDTGSEKAETEVSGQIRSAQSENDILARSQSEGDVTNADDVKLPFNGVNGKSNNITINVDCHDDPEDDDDHLDAPSRCSIDRLTPDRLSRTSFGTGPLSRASLISVKSASILSIKPDARTVWTQTDKTESVVETQTSTDNLLAVPSATENKSSYCLTSDTGSEFETPWESMEFGVDDLARRGVENPVLAANRDRILRRLGCPNIDDTDAELCVDLLRFAKVPYLAALNRKISSEIGSFNEDFICHRGLDFLLVIMEEIATGGLPSFHDVTKMMLVSECATSLVNSQTGRDFIIEHGEYVVSFARGKIIPFYSAKPPV